MSNVVSINTLRRPVDPYATPATATILRFMTAHGHPGYEAHIHNAQSAFDEVQAEAGPNGYLCPETQHLLDMFNQEIEEAAQAAVDRYEDWASD